MYKKKHKNNKILLKNVLSYDFIYDLFGVICNTKRRRQNFINEISLQINSK